MPTNNILNYTGLTYNEMRDSVISRLAQDSRFANYSQSQLYSVISEIFLAATAPEGGCMHLTPFCFAFRC